jgi:hypothetical protein
MLRVECPAPAERDSPRPKEEHPEQPHFPYLIDFDLYLAFVSP